MPPQTVTIQAKDIAIAELLLSSKLRVMTALNLGRGTTASGIPKGCQGTEGHGKISSSGGDKDVSRDGAIAASGNEDESLLMSKRITLSKLTKRVYDKKSNEGSKVATSSNTRVVIREKWPRDEIQDLVADDSKGKEVAPLSEAKKAKPRRAASRGVTPPIVPTGNLPRCLLPRNRVRFWVKALLSRYHPNLGIDLDNIGLDHDLLKEEEKEEKDEEAKERKKEEIREKGEE
ncbi:hypothetical protein Acr_00g0014830 [Actinidia rufa]|uniref:Uncharacterized protein n=1 Tax=Actinidia rufa TaxID=165716 RepID=A0A7J0DC93_9ERIC|nr:hypothetical protein Acr_00g0014830 [Actinidia rufa]